MIVACPSCGARFNLDSTKLLPAGRNVRCAKCDHRWRQMPEGFDEPAAQAGSAPAPEPAAPARAAPESLAPQVEEPEPHPPTPPETPAQMAQSLAAIAEQVAGARAPGDGYTVSQASPQTANPLGRLGRRTGPGPITVPPRMRPMRPAKRNSHLGLILVAGFVIGLLAAGYLFRDVIARTVPGADVIYSLLGMSMDNAASDLEISNIVGKITKNEKTGENAIDVTATIFNQSDHPVNMPTLMVVPIDDVGSEMEPMRFRLKELVIAPGQNINFRKSFDNWPKTASSATLKVADAP